MFEDWGMEGSLGMTHLQDIVLRTSVRPHRQMFTGNVSEVPDIHIRLECDEVIDDWDSVEGAENGTFSQYQKELTETCHELQKPNSQPPPNSPVKTTGDIDEGIQAEFYATNKYVRNLLQIWRDSSEYNDESEESTQATCSDSQGSSFSLLSDSQSLPSDASSQTSNSSEDSCGKKEPKEICYPMIDKSVSQPLQYENENECGNCQPEDGSFSTSSHEDVLDDVNNRYSPVHSVQEELGDPRAERAFSPVQEETSTDNEGWNSRTPSPTLEEIHSDMLNLSQQRSSSPSLLEEIEANIADLPLEDYMYIVFPEQRFPTRHVTQQWPANDHEVPDIEMASDISDSEELPFALRRRPNSCTDQVVPSAVEE